MIDRGRFRSAFKLAGLIFLVTVILEIIAYLITKFLDSAIPFQVFPLAFLITAFAFTGLLLVVLLWQSPRINRLARASAEYRHGSEISNRRFLITGFSKMMNSETKDGDPISWKEILKQFKRENATIEDACDKTGKFRIQWQQNLRVISDLQKHTNSGIEAVYIILPSTEVDEIVGKTDGESENQANEFKAFVEHYFASTLREKVYFVTLKDGKTPFARIEPSSGKLTRNYEYYDYVRTAIDRALEQIAADHELTGYQNEELTVLDITAGQKVFSVAAAIQTLNRRLVFAYAGTHDAAGKVSYFDAEVSLAGADFL